MDRETGGLQSMGSQRVRHDLATKQQLFIYSYINVSHKYHDKIKSKLYLNSYVFIVI